MFDTLARAMYGGRRLVLVLAGAFLVFAGVWGTGAFGALSDGGFEDPNSESFRADAELSQALGRSDADVVVLYSSDTLTVDDPEFAEAVTSTLASLPTDEVVGATSFFSTDAPQFVSADRHSTYVVVQLTGADEELRADQVDAVEPALDAPGLTEQVGGIAAVNRDITEQVTEDIAFAETLSLPILFVLLIIIFGGLVAASMPLIIGVFAVLGAFTMIRLLTLFTDVSVFAINIVIFLGLGLAIDYGLFVVSRFREELRTGRDVPAALRRTMQTAGRTVAVSGITVAISLAGLTLFPQNFLRSMGFGGMAAVLVAMVAALTVLPALLAVIGHRIEALSVRPLLRRLTPWRRTAASGSGASQVGASQGAWYRIARSVMRRPVLYAAGIVVILLLLGTPFLRASFGGIDARVLPEGTPSRVVSEALESDFGGAADPAVTLAVTVAGSIEDPGTQQELAAYVGQVGQLTGVETAELSGAAGSTAEVSVFLSGDAISASSREIVDEIRALSPPADGEVLVGGETAVLVDLLDSIGSTLPLMALIVAVATFVLLFLAFGSVVLPIKAIVMNVLSLGATFGALVLIFQDGNLSGLLGFTSTGTIEATQPILVLAIAFGLSMDYEVFLLSRVREQYDLTGDNTEAVATGLQRTGGIITSAALLLVVVIGAFATSGIVFIKLIGVAMVIAIIVDATIVRTLLVPATMRLLGRANWWAPGPLRLVYERFGIREDTPAEPAESAEPAETRELVRA